MLRQLYDKPLDTCNSIGTLRYPWTMGPARENTSRVQIPQKDLQNVTAEAWMMEATTPDKMSPQVASILQSLTNFDLKVGLATSGETFLLSRAHERGQDGCCGISLSNSDWGFCIDIIWTAFNQSLDMSIATVVTAFCIGHFANSSYSHRICEIIVTNTSGEVAKGIIGVLSEAPEMTMPNIPLSTTAIYHQYITVQKSRLPTDMSPNMAQKINCPTNPFRLRPSPARSSHTLSHRV